MNTNIKSYISKTHNSYRTTHKDNLTQESSIKEMRTQQQETQK